MYEIDIEDSFALSNFVLEPESTRALRSAARRVKDVSFPQDDWFRSSSAIAKSSWEHKASPIHEIHVLQARVEELEALLEFSTTRSTKDVLAIRYENIKKVGLVSALVFTLFLALYAFTSVLVVNPVFSAFGIVGSIMIWLMAIVDQRYRS
ncbi:MAG TPA: hypothetical protein VN843_36545 [Anaerolineales bacterium]|nr:hypothetical protein [Anaerolineales bacterium]